MPAILSLQLWFNNLFVCLSDLSKHLRISEPCSTPTQCKI
jgi:hypothetical protein